MAHIQLNEQLPGIVGLFNFRPETARPFNQLVHLLLTGQSSLTQGEREMIAAYVSYRNECKFCHNSHGAAAQYLMSDNPGVMDAVRNDVATAAISGKMKALLNIAGKVQRDGRLVTDDDVAAARAEDATDIEIHDTVLIAAVFCMANRYVDGLGTWAPDDPAVYEVMGAHLATEGYV